MTAWAAIHQFVPAVYPRDAIGGHVRRLRSALRDRGIASDIHVEATEPETAAETLPMRELAASNDEPTLFVYHMATGSALADVLVTRPEPLVVVHHNLTPIELMAPWDPEAVHQLTLARRQLQALAKVADLGIGVSEFNRAQLDSLGFARTATAPLLFDATSTPNSPPSIDADPVVLFVGRVAPNKGHHDLIKALALLRSRQPKAQLRLVGPVATPRYHAALVDLVSALGLDDAVTFTGGVSDAELHDEYRAASVFCCLSDHEGVGMPLIEAMAHAVPVVAYSSSAIPETVGPGGLLLPSKDPATVATAIAKVIDSPELAARLRIAGHNRILAFDPTDAVDQFLQVVGEVTP